MKVIALLPIIPISSRNIALFVHITHTLYAEGNARCDIERWRLNEDEELYVIKSFT